MMNPILADFMISGDWVVTAAVGLIPVLSGVWIKAKRAGLREATNNITLQAPVPTVPISKVYSPPTFSQHMEVVRRVEKLETSHEELSRELRREMGESFRRLMEVGEERKDKLMDKIDASAKGFHERVNQIVNEFHHAPKK
jgi:adenine-specific DNA methylase